MLISLFKDLDMVTSEAFWNGMAEKYARQPIKDVHAYNQTMDRTKSYLSETDRVLEVGCGTGSTALLLSGSVGHITASDISTNMIGIAEGIARDQGVGNVRFVRGTVADHVGRDGPFDAVLAFNFLHLHEDLPAALRQLHGLLKPGGLFISKTVCIADKWVWRVMIPMMQAFGKAPYVTVLSVSKLEEHVSDAGFKIIETGDYPTRTSRFIVARKV